jgi:hypothetical protein
MREDARSAQRLAHVCFALVALSLALISLGAVIRLR